MKKSIIIVGAGPGLSMGVAQKFGAAGFEVGLISRNETKLQQLVQQLAEQSIPASYALADAYDTNKLEIAVQKLEQVLGGCTILFYNAAALKMNDLLKENVDSLVADFKITAAHLLHLTQVLRPQLKQNQGAILVTGAALGIRPMTMFGSLSLGKAALRNLSLQLHELLQPEGIYVGTLTIDGYIQADSPSHAPSILADKFWQLYQDRTVAELQY